MGRTGVTYREVWEAAATLQGQQKPITIDNIRNLLGTGSRSTLADHLRTWKANTEEAGNTASLPTQLNALVTGLWEKLNQHADAKITEHQESTDAELRAADENIRTLNAENTDVKQQKEVLAEKLHACQHAEKTLKTQLIDAQHTMASDNARLSALTDQLNTQETESKRLHELCQHIQSNLEHFQGAAQKRADEQARTFDQQRQQLEQQLRKTQASLGEALHDKQLLASQHTQITQQLSALKHETQQHKAMITEMQQKCSDAHAENRALNDQLKALKAQRDTLQSDLKKAEHQCAQAQASVNVAWKHNQSLEKRLNVAEDSLTTLRDKQLFLIQEKAVLEGQLQAVLGKAKKAK